jgi:glycosyltransferase involved in cell wall biosynthesis
MSTDIDVRVIELSDYGPDFVVQKNKIKAILGDKLYLADDTDKNKRILNLIEDFKPDVIHFEECPESSDRKLEPSTIEKIYSKDRTYQIVETCHNIWMTNDKKIWHPNSYMYCTPYHPLNNFKDTKSAGTVIQYPLENLIPTNQEKLDARLELGFKDNKIHVLNVGLWTKGKNQGEAVEMARKLNKIHPNKFVFHFVGNQAGNFREYWEPIMKNLPENVNVWGGRNDVDVFLKASDVFLFTSIIR